MGTAFGVMKRFKGLRGGALDVFGKTEERRQERQLVEDYIRQLDASIAVLTPASHATAVTLAQIPDEIRGYGHVKQASVRAAKVAEQSLLAPRREPEPRREAVQA